MDSEENSKQEQGDELVQRLRHWQQVHPEATLTEIEEAVEAELAGVRKRLVEGMVKEREAAGQERPECPECGARMFKNGRRQRQLKGKEGQVIELDRQQWRCLSCEATLFPPG
ncbi:MAG: hypothetical protein M9896_19150 [Candidatus Promineofilum sp.]|uniref:hypothetical protein n=1 Tax=Promineifilum sp. TaxID=2664178 RepID=UPI002411E336|nr:hypothetical protein [Promineifilum sp.]